MSKNAFCSISHFSQIDLDMRLVYVGPTKVSMSDMIWFRDIP